MTYLSQLNSDFSYDYLLKVLICGDSFVGKTSVLTRFVSNKFRVTHIRTLGVDFMMKYVIVQGKKIQLKIWDTAGQEDHDSITAQYFRRSNGILLAYDITSQESFNNLSKWVEKLKESVPQFEDTKVPIVLIGNKIDLEDQRVITYSQGLQFAQQHDMPFYETSCATSVNVKQAVCGLVAKIIEEIAPVDPGSVKPISGSLPPSYNQVTSTEPPNYHSTPVSNNGNNIVQSDSSIVLSNDNTNNSSNKDRWCPC
ncbi:ras-related protein Rab-10-like [Dysidea avara]|uniref:ras-related protein Rab-10-like n=1 Tax=Dysidea avara TaxID=196820 RepID=UPI00332E8A32